VDLQLDGYQSGLVEKARRFVDEVCVPYAANWPISDYDADEATVAKIRKAFTEWGFRGLAVPTRSGGQGQGAFSRPGNNFCSRFPDLTENLAESLGGHSVVLDGEVIARDGEGRPNFARLQRRLRVQRPSRTLLASVPASYCVFDVLHLDGQDLTSRPYTQRRAILEDLALPSGPIVVPPVWQDLPGTVLLAAAAELDLEGAVFKRSDSRYRAGRRSRSWIRCPIRKRAIVAILGWTRGHAQPVGALVIGAHDSQGNLVYCGIVTSGLGQANRRSLQHPVGQPRARRRYRVPRVHRTPFSPPSVERPGRRFARGGGAARPPVGLPHNLLSRHAGG